MSSVGTSKGIVEIAKFGIYVAVLIVLMYTFANNTENIQKFMGNVGWNGTGPGASSGRVKWRGYQAIQSANEASKFTVANFIAGGSWLPKLGVPFTTGL